MAEQRASEAEQRAELAEERAREADRRAAIAESRVAVQRAAALYYRWHHHEMGQELEHTRSELRFAQQTLQHVKADAIEAHNLACEINTHGNRIVEPDVAAEVWRERVCPRTRRPYRLAGHITQVLGDLLNYVGSDNEEEEEDEAEEEEPDTDVPDDDDWSVVEEAEDTDDA